MRISDWSSDVCSYDLIGILPEKGPVRIDDPVVRIIGADEPIDRSRLAFDVQFLREALDPSDRVLEQDFERRAAPVRERIALEIIVARQRDELHRLAEVLIREQLEHPETIVLGAGNARDAPGNGKR